MAVTRSTLVSACGDGTVRVWSLDYDKQELTIGELMTLNEHSVAVASLACLSNGRQCLVAHQDGTLMLIDLRTLRVIARRDAESRGDVLARCTLTPCGTYALLTSAKSHEVSVFAAAVNTLELVDSISLQDSARNAAKSLTVHPFDHQMAVTCANCTNIYTHRDEEA